jgi:putative transposase
MVRPIRIEKSDAFYHVMARGNQGDLIFEEDGDKLYFLDHLGKASQKYGAVFYGYCLLGNHYHLLVETKEPNLSSLMHYINSSFASHLRRRRRVGHIFSGRYKSVIAEKGEHLAPLSRYVHLNPVRASLVRLPEEYHWSSYRYLLEDGTVPDWLETSWVVDLFGATIKAARARYKEYVENGTLDEFSFESDLLSGGIILGNDRFIRDIIKRESVRKDLPRETAGLNRFARPMQLSELYMATCSFFALESLVGVDGKPDGNSRKARNMFIWLAREYTAAQNHEIGAFVGSLGNSGISKQYVRIKGAMKSEEDGAGEWLYDAERILSIVRG